VQGGAGQGQKLKPSHWGSVLANNILGSCILGRGDHIGVGSIKFEVVGVLYLYLRTQLNPFSQVNWTSPHPSDGIL
jgi:hypothetical protein